MRKAVWGLFLIVALIGLAACSGPEATPQPPTAVVLPTATPSPTTAAENIAPTLPPTAPPLPTPEILTTTELHQRLDPLTGWIEGCTLPCYNGLTPGEAGVAEVLAFYARLGIGVPDLIPGDAQSLQSGTGDVGAWLTKTSDVLQAEELGLAPPLVNVSLEDGVARYVYVGWQYYPSYLTALRVLESLGPPERLDLALVFEEDPPTFLLELVYPSLRAGFAFSGEMPADDAGRRVCLSSEQVDVTYFGIFAPEMAPMEGLANSVYLLPLEETLGLPYEEFAALVNAGECLTIPPERWEPWLAIQEELQQPDG